MNISAKETPTRLGWVFCLLPKKGKAVKHLMKYIIKNRHHDKKKKKSNGILRI